VRPRLRCVNRCAAMASPHHVAPVACAPHRRNRPTPLAVAVAVGAARWWHHDPSAIGGHEVTDEVVGEIVARLDHCDVVPRTTDKDSEDR
jgi:hypothetical protein